MSSAAARAGENEKCADYSNPEDVTASEEHRLCNANRTSLLFTAKRNHAVLHTLASSAQQNRKRRPPKIELASLERPQNFVVFTSVYHTRDDELIMALQVH